MARYTQWPKVCCNQYALLLLAEEKGRQKVDRKTSLPKSESIGFFVCIEAPARALLCAALSILFDALTSSVHIQQSRRPSKMLCQVLPLITKECMKMPFAYKPPMLISTKEMSFSLKSFLF